MSHRWISSPESAIFIKIIIKKHDATLLLRTKSTEWSTAASLTSDERRTLRMNYFILNLSQYHSPIKVVWDKELKWMQKFGCKSCLA